MTEEHAYSIRNKFLQQNKMQLNTIIRQDS